MTQLAFLASDFRELHKHSRKAKQATLDFSRPDEPTDNGFIEVLNSKLRVDCLNAHRFMSLADAREKAGGLE